MSSPLHADARESTVNIHSDAAAPISSKCKPVDIRWNDRACIRLTAWWLAAVLLLHILNAVRTVMDSVLGDDHGLTLFLEHWFTVQGEDTVPAWFSGVMLWSAGLLLAVTATMSRRLKRPGVLIWILLAAVFFYLSADEVLSFHEKLNGLTRRMLDADLSLRVPWIYPALIFTAMMGAASFPLLRRLSHTVRRIILLAAAVYLTGAIGFEWIGETVKAHNQSSDSLWVYTLIFSMEEFLEMMGVVIFIHALHLQLLSLSRAWLVKRLETIESDRQFPPKAA